MAEYSGFGVEIRLKDDKIISGTVQGVNDKLLTLSDVVFPDGGKSKVFRVKGDKLQDLKVIRAPSKKKSNNKEKKPKTFSNTDWDEDVAKIKKSGDFDFGGNLARFNKASVFDELREKDNIDPQQRLVGHNKVEKVNYDINEMVTAPSNTNWEDKFFPITESINITHLLKSQSATPVDTTRSSSIAVSVQFVNGKIVVPTASPVQLLEIERQTFESCRVPALLVTETISVHVSRLIINRLGGGSRIVDNHNSAPLVVLLVGNNRAGARTLATARQLTNHGVKAVALTVAELDDENVLHQLEMYKLAGGKVVASVGSLESAMDSVPVELIVDGLQGFDGNLSDLEGDELHCAHQAVEWANKKQCATLSLDIPSGLDSGSGLPGEDDIYIEANAVISLGLPLAGLSHAYFNGVVNQGDWDHFLVDVGTPVKLFKKGSLKKFDLNIFAGEAVVSLNTV